MLPTEYLIFDNPRQCGHRGRTEAARRTARPRQTPLPSGEVPRLLRRRRCLARPPRTVDDDDDYDDDTKDADVDLILLILSFSCPAMPSPKARIDHDRPTRQACVVGIDRPSR